MDKATVTKVAKLARIRLTDAEIETMTGELTHIMGWIEQLSEVDTEGVPLMTSVASMKLPLRKDEVTDGNRQTDIVANAPESEHGCFAVPKVVE